MKPFARKTCPAVAWRRLILVASLALAAVGVEWLLIAYRDPLHVFISYDPHVSVVRTALMVAGGLIVVAAAALAVSRRISPRRRALAIVSDRAAVRGFAVAMLLVWVFCWTLMGCVGCDATSFGAGAQSFLTLFGSAVAIRAKDKWWIIVYWLIWLLCGALCCPAC